MQLHLSGVLSAEDIKRIVDMIAQAPAGEGWIDGRATSGPQSALAKNNQQTPERSPITAQAREIVVSAITKNPQFVTASLPRRLYPPNFNRYADKANAFGNHIDNALRNMQGFGSSGYLRTDMSCTVFLSEPQDYDGGELVIASASGENAYKLAAGDLILYPASTVHRVNPVTRGARVACFFWIESMVRSLEQRVLLYEMDMAILALRENAGDTPEAVRLTGVYHNLLRMWADV